MTRAVFLDRDGVLVEDVDLLTSVDEIRIRPEAPGALARLGGAGFRLVVVSNQAAVARGLIDERTVERIEERVEEVLRAAGAPPLDGFYYCPHHPEATLEAYRVTCDCRKPRAGLLRRAAGEHGIDLARSFLVGDRLTDIAAGREAGCTTVLVRTGAHAAAPIVTVEPLESDLRADVTCADLAEAAAWILAR